MADVKVLTAAEVAKELSLGIKICRQLFGFSSDDHTLPINIGVAESLADELEALRADRDRLLGLIEKVPHEMRCRSRLPLPFGEKARAEFDGKCNCVKSQVTR